MDLLDSVQSGGAPLFLGSYYRHNIALACLGYLGSRVTQAPLWDQGTDSAIIQVCPRQRKTACVLGAFSKYKLSCAVPTKTFCIMCTGLPPDGAANS